MGKDADTRAVEYGGVTYRVSLAHPAADAMPWHLDRPEFADLVASMRDGGGYDRTHPIIRHHDTKLIINGRRRELAALVAGVEATYEEVRWDDEEIAEWVRREDLIRRNLTPSERAAAAVELAALLPRGGDRKSATYADQTANLRFDSAAEIAEQAGVSQRTVEDVAKVKKEAPELLPAVKEGKLAANVAAKVADLPKKERAKVAAAADPKKAAKEAVAKAAEPEPAPAANVIPPPAVDAWGIPIQPHAAEAFEAVPKFKELAAAIQAAQKLFNEVANLPGGKFLTLPDVSSYRRGKKSGDGEYADRFVHEGLETAFRQVKAATPTHTVCPYSYAEAAHPADCPCCKSLNWTPVLGNSIPAACVERAKAAFGVTEGRSDA